MLSCLDLLYLCSAAAAFRLVDLPLNGQAQQQLQAVVQSDPLEAAAAAAQLDEEDVQLLMSQVS
jgi:NACalpha-BTF3-like transcription factor